MAVTYIYYTHDLINNFATCLSCVCNCSDQPYLTIFLAIHIYDHSCIHMYMFADPNVHHFQAVSDLDKGWTVGSKEAYAKLEELKKKGDKLQVRLSRYPYTQFNAVIEVYNL